MFTRLFNPFATEVSLASTPFLFITRLMLIKIYVLCIGPVAISLLGRGAVWFSSLSSETLLK